MKSSSIDREFTEVLLHFRVIKSAVASFIALISSYYIGFEYALFPALAACFCIRQTFVGSLKTFYIELKMTGHATLVALLAGGTMELFHIYGYKIKFLDYFIVALAIGGVIVVVEYFRWYNAVFIGLLTVLYVLLLPELGEYDKMFLARGVRRFGSIIVGSTIALVVDFLFSGYEYNRLFYQRTQQALDSIETMLEQFVEAIVLEDREKADSILDQAVEGLNLLNYISDNLDDLEKEMEFRGDEIHDFSHKQVDILNRLVRNLRLICYQMEAAGINYRRLLDNINNSENPLSETKYEEMTARVRELSSSLRYLREAIESESTEPLENITRFEDFELSYNQLFEENKVSTDLEILTFDTMASIHRIEYYLGEIADILEMYFELRKNGSMLEQESGQ
ncbi:MAG: aromatic acid exporter family protein [bacterium]